MFKKLLSFLLGLALFTGIAVVPTTAAETAETPGLVTALGIINSDVDSGVDNVSRELAAIYVARMLNIDENKATDKRYFVDVENGGFAENAINMLVDLDILSVPQNHMFNPERDVTVNELAKMLVSAAGYREYAEIRGGYPSGYITTARQLGISLDAANPSQLTVAEAGNMIYDALLAPVYDIKSVSTDGDVRYEANDYNSVLAVYWDMHKGKGAVQATYGGSIDRVSFAENKDEAVINNTKYTTADSISLIPFLGSYVTYFYKDKGDGIPGEILAVEKSGVLEDICIDTDDFSGYLNEELTYYNDLGKAKKISLDDPVILYNGSVLGSGEKAMFESLNKGRIEVKDCNNDDRYDFIAVTDYKNFLVSAKDEVKGCLYNGFDNSFKVLLSDYDNQIIVDENGNYLEIKDISVKQILSVAAAKDKKVIEIILCTTTFTGRVESVFQSGNKFEIVINGNTYEVDPSYLAEFKKTYTMDREFSFVVDKLGKIVYISEELNFDYEYGYLIDGVVEGTFSNEFKVKLLTKNGELKILDAGNRLVIDGKSYKESNFNEALSYLSDADGFVPQLVRYQLKDEKLFKLDTAAVNESGGENNTNSLYDVFKAEKDKQAAETGKKTEYMSGVWYNTYNLGRKCIIKSSTPVFYVPFRGESYSETDFGVRTAGSVFESDSEYTVNAYQSSSLNAYADAIVYYVSSDYFTTNENVSKMVIVDEVMQIFENEEEYYAVKGFKGGAEATVKIPVSEGIKTETLRRGDVVMFAEDYSGNVVYYNGTPNGYKMIYEHSPQGPVAGEKWKDNNLSGYKLYNTSDEKNWHYWSSFQISFGNVMYKNDTVARWSSYGFDEYEEVADLNGLPIVVFDEFCDEVRAGTVADIVDYKSAAEKCSRILYFTQRGAGKLAVIYNYK